VFDDRILLAKKAAWENRFLNSCGLALQADSAQNAPVDTGNLKNSISYKVEGDSVQCGSQVKYANIQEIRNGFFVGALDKIGAQINKLISAAGDL
jgi:hypothetical protein